MAQPLPIFRETTGLNNVIDPVSHKYNPGIGVQELAAAYNVDVDDTGRVSRRKGFYKGLSKSSPHSLFSWGGLYALFVTGDALTVLDPDFTNTPIRNVTVGARMSYADAAGTVYYCNGYEKGLVRNRLSFEWIDQDYVGPPTYKAFSDPPIGHLLELWNGRMLVGVDDLICYSEPFAFGRFRLASNYIQLSSRVTLIKGVKAGVFAGDEEATYFLPGTDCVALGNVKVADYPPIPGTAVMVDGSKIGNGDLVDRCAMWTSTKGICLGTSEGIFRNLTERKLTYPISIRGAGVYLGNRYVCTLEP